MAAMREVWGVGFAIFYPLFRNFQFTLGLWQKFWLALPGKISGGAHAVNVRTCCLCRVVMRTCRKN